MALGEIATEERRHDRGGRLIDGLSDDAVHELVDSAREVDYRALAKEIRAVADATPA